MSNTIKPKVSTPISTPSGQPKPATTPAATTTHSTKPAGWSAGVQSRAPSASAQAIAPGSGQKEVICPVLRAMVNEGRVQMRPDGSVSVDELNKAVKDLGGSAALGAATWGIGTIGNKPTDILRNILHHEFNVVNLPEGIVPHPADSKILRSGKFDEAKFNDFVSHAENGVMTTDSIAKAIAASFKRDVANGDNVLDASVRGLNFAEVEFAGLLAVFGSKDNPTGKTGIRVDDLRTLYETGTIPPRMQNQRSSVIEATALQASLKVKTDAALARDALGSVFTATGLSSAGARLSGANAKDTEKTASQLASLSAGKAANCPHLAGQMKMPKSPAGVVNAHTPAGQ